MLRKCYALLIVLLSIVCIPNVGWTNVVHDFRLSTWLDTPQQVINSECNKQWKPANNSYVFTDNL